MTDGEPSTDAWVTPFNKLTDDSDSYDITIDAFGFGRRYVEGSLDEIDADAVLLESPSLLADAFAALPLFNPKLF